MKAEEVDWHSMREANAENWRTVKELTAKAGVLDDGSNWSPKLLKDGLETWEYYFMLASGFDALANNGGLVHGLHCYFDEEPGTEHYVPKEDMLACWEATGCGFLVQAQELGRRELNRYGVKRYDSLTLEQEEEVEEILDDALDKYDEPPGIQPFEIRWAAYARKHRSSD